MSKGIVLLDETVLEAFGFRRDPPPAPPLRPISFPGAKTKYFLILLIVRLFQAKYSYSPRHVFDGSYDDLLVGLESKDALCGRHARWLAEVGECEPEELFALFSHYHMNCCASNTCLDANLTRRLLNLNTTDQWDRWQLAGASVKEFDDERIWQ